MGLRLDGQGFFGVIADLKYNKVSASIDSPA
jgi:hypothetical protein